MLFQVFLAAVLAVSVAAQNSTNVTVTAVAQAFTAAKLVPDVLPAFKPAALLNVVFLDNTTGVSVNVTPGINLTREPAQIRHLLAPGIVVNGSLATGAALVNNTPAISNFLRPTPPAGSDPHRYTLLLFIQPSNFTTAVSSFVNSSTPVNNFNISLFAQELGLGSPIAGNFFLTGPDANSTNGLSVNVTPGINLQITEQRKHRAFEAVLLQVAMVDPDVATAQICHLLAPGLVMNGSLTTGEVLANLTPAISEYLSPAPTAGSDPHRYTLRLYVRPLHSTAAVSRVVNPPYADSRLHRLAFRAGAWSGGPIAGNFFGFSTGPVCEFD
ncbi:hypothetical protein ONZ51_g4547 [Trametes cubensis]|uniref:PEBP-like protein n=1 Tax=Trametes cubensis TaxID=1111947 RepID=A0AAD7TVM1_9APHY|nr:hypothetical protein ONZ51_g4547 [Trametes cubensis]